MSDTRATIARDARRWGWTALCLYACMGVALEAAHALKLPVYLDDPLAQFLLRLGHAHGVGLAQDFVRGFVAEPLRLDIGQPRHGSFDRTHPDQLVRGC